MYRKIWLLMFVLLITIALVSACNTTVSRRINCACTNIGNEMKCRYSLFTDQETSRIKLTSKETIEISYKVAVESGNLQIRLLNPNKEVVWDKTFEDDAMDTVSYQIVEGGRYTLVVEGFDTEGSFELSWQVQE